jgi:hypothetical protein
LKSEKNPSSTVYSQYLLPAQLALGFKIWIVVHTKKRTAIRIICHEMVIDGWHPFKLHQFRASHNSALCRYGNDNDSGPFSAANRVVAQKQKR